ncbi:FKBP-type peptidyl-prolyl cis-trans isomerase [Pedobacter boryungensis]|uniref:Peptidyl-prolyl cis-trans isomerase n=1 Tax=Pedobacter boryungensis TaxID=869962 RepID=A0ABX2DF06_9SPHI|nr:FKBP-type peptidyl-prolyl cis-trans isomerase [Pedobacter boryungensis]NQX32048.1 FKBP-type peptidyl-prolyl cis-trans isomerase [Pedobacter boryungensis]
MSKKLTIYSFALLGVLVLFNSCKKEYESIESIDEAKIQAYIKQNNLTMTKDPSGFYYQVVSQGAGDAMLNKDSVLYDFNIKSLAGVEYQKNSAISNFGNYLGYITPSPYRIALTNLKRGSSVKVIFPSYLAFGKNGSGNIPSNEVLISEISTYTQKTQWELDDIKIKAFLTTKGIAATKDPSRVYYQVLTAGTGTDAINQNSTLVVKYTGRLLDGTVFDSNTSYSTTLNGVIVGWGKILPLFKSGAKIRIFIPSDLAYSSIGNGLIPANASLDFDIEIVSVTN